MRSAAARHLLVVITVLGSHLLRSQGTVTPVKVLDLTPMGSTYLISMRSCGATNNRICYSTETRFGAQGSTSAIYSTDGTSAGATKHKEIQPTMTIVQTTGDIVYYRTGHGFGGYGFAYGSTDLSRVEPGPTAPLLELVPQMTPHTELAPQVVNGKLVCAMNWSLEVGVELISVPAIGGSKGLIKDIEVGPASGCDHTGSGSTCTLAGKMFFQANTTATGLELWTSDGTAAGTQQFSNFTSGTQPSFYSNYLTTLGTRIYMSGSETGTNTEPWMCTATSGSLAKLKEIAPGSAKGSDPMEFTQIGKTVYFTANDGTNGRQLWMTDGTAAATHLVKDLKSGKGIAEPHHLTVFNGKLYFFTTNSQTKAINLYRTDGTSAGTQLCHSIATEGYITGTAATNGRLYYQLASGDWQRNGLWRTDGTTAGMQEVKPVNATSVAPIKQRDVVAKGSTLFFTADYTGSGTSLWKITDPLTIPTLPTLPTR